MAVQTTPHAQTHVSQSTDVRLHAACGVRFEVPVGFKVGPVEPADACTLCIAKSICAGDEAHLVLSVHEAALRAALARDSGWEPDEADRRQWTRRGYGIGHGSIVQAQGLQRLGVSYSTNCGSGRGPSEAMACDAYAGAVSNGRRTVLLDSIGLDEEAIRLLASIRFETGKAK